MITLHIDPKFSIQVETSQFEPPTVRIVNPAGVPIPIDEPLFLLRARDRNALALIERYREVCTDDGCTDYQLSGIDNRIVAFREFAKKHPDRMKQPGITRGM